MKNNLILVFILQYMKEIGCCNNLCEWSSWTQQGACENKRMLQERTLCCPSKEQKNCLEVCRRDVKDSFRYVQCDLKTPVFEKYELESSSAMAFFNSLSHRRQKRGVSEECREGCSYEEVDEVYHWSYVCTYMENYKCARTYCPAGTICTPTNYGHCGHLNNVVVECK
ncbi:uncharacterized protein LOC134233775, partial [Saccostrea cucullata]|uniref:uncharacterized protein LOC134233775 n=1 Tax=Saccostrea cuccullata TaxID=36930 RepID=UPI002ED3BF67